MAEFPRIAWDRPRRAGRRYSAVAAVGVRRLFPGDPLDGAAGSDVLGHQPPRAGIGLRLDIDRPQIAVVYVLQRHRHDAGVAIDIDAAKKLQPETGRKIFTLAALLEHRLRAKRIVERTWGPCPRMQRAGDEFPERVELPEHGAARIVMM